MFKVKRKLFTGFLSLALGVTAFGLGGMQVGAIRLPIRLQDLKGKCETCQRTQTAAQREVAQRILEIIRNYEETLDVQSESLDQLIQEFGIEDISSDESVNALTKKLKKMLFNVDMLSLKEDDKQPLRFFLNDLIEGLRETDYALAPYIGILKDRCPICMASMQDDEELYRTACGHTFHLGCFATWADLHHECPICRQPV